MEFWDKFKFGMTQGHESFIEFIHLVIQVEDENEKTKKEPSREQP